jgi:acyl-CoA reductase-like NAD-dependent aldehyde dehydrogenase
VDSDIVSKAESALKVGGGTVAAAAANRCGPVISKTSQGTHRRFDRTKVQPRACHRLDGRNPPAVPGYEKVISSHPTIFSNVLKPGMKIYDEIFGPVLVIVNVDTLKDDAIALVTANPYSSLALASSRNRVPLLARKFQMKSMSVRVGINVPFPCRCPPLWPSLAHAAQSWAI